MIICTELVLHLSLIYGIVLLKNTQLYHKLGEENLLFSSSIHLYGKNALHLRYFATDDNQLTRRLHDPTPFELHNRKQHHRVHHKTKNNAASVASRSNQGFYHNKRSYIIIHVITNASTETSFIEQN